MVKNKINFGMEKLKNYGKIKSKYKDLRYNIVELDGENINNESDIFKIFSTQLSFPSYFGKNWDAFFDCIKDLMWLNKENTVVLIKNYGLLEKKSLTNPFYDILNDAQKFWKKQKIEFKIILFGKQQK